MISYYGRDFLEISQNSLFVEKKSPQEFEKLTNQLPSNLPPVFDCDESDTSGRIINGDKASEPWKFLIQLRIFEGLSSAHHYPDNYGGCAGVIINDSWGITGLIF